MKMMGVPSSCECAERPSSGPASESRSKYLALAAFSVLIILVSIFSASKSSWPLFVAASIVSFLPLVWLIRNEVLTAKQVVIGALLFRCLFIWMPPNLSDDAYRYLWDGRVLIEGENPYLHTPKNLVASGIMIEDEVYESLNSKDLYTVYPPVSQYIFALGAFVANTFDSWRVGYYFLKLLFLICEMMAIVLLLRMVSPGFVLLYAWNPLVIVETAGQIHTESILVTLLVASIWFYRRQQHGVAAVGLGLAVWVKLYPILFIPLLLRRVKFRYLLLSGFVGCLVALPFFHKDVPTNVLSSLDLYVRYFEFNAGFYFLVKKIFLVVTGDDHSKSIGPAFRMILFGVLTVIYAVDWKKNLTLERAIFWITGAYLFLATTVHPWYLLGLLCLLPLLKATNASERLRRHWNVSALAVFSLGTYLLYVDGPYWTFVVLGWTSWIVLTTAGMLEPFLDLVIRRRSLSKYTWIAPLLPRSRDGRKVLDLGAGEGYIGQLISTRLGADVSLVDVVDFNKTDLPFQLYDGETLPYDDDSFEMTVAYFVLHHAKNPERVLAEAARVTSGSLVIVESTFNNSIGKILLTRADRLANRLRSAGLMNSQEEVLNFRRDEEWRHAIDAAGLDIVDIKTKGRLVHIQVAYKLEKRQ